MRFFSGMLLSLFLLQGSALKIVDLRTTKEITFLELKNIAMEYKYILLGEYHNHASHHQIRGDLLTMFQTNDINVVAEHLEFNRFVHWSSDVLESLELQNFDAKNWKWPVHLPLFKVMQENNISLIGGNITNEKSKSILKDGSIAIPTYIASLVEQTPLSNKSYEKLKKDLIQGHCGYIQGDKILNMALVQHVKDASMGLALSTNPKKNNFLIAGNGHIRKDYGVYRILNYLDSINKPLVIGFLTLTQSDMSQEWLKEQYDIVVFTDDIFEEDFCKKLKNQIIFKNLEAIELHES